ncbi:MAG: leucine-rich repeat domain-containing protein [Bacilli bacterium]|nr:leucine-rich repeat domain-containing protein [Bacilli bacterium]
MKRLLAYALTLVSLASLSACAKPIPAELIILNDGSKGVVTIEGKLEVNSTVTIRVKPSQNDYVFDEWYEVDGDERYPYDFHNPLEFTIKTSKVTLETSWVSKYSEGLHFEPQQDPLSIHYTWKVSQYDLPGETSVIIPPIYHARAVTHIANDLFKGKASVQEVLLPEGITDIGTEAFDDTSITEITMPSTLVNAANAFQHWTSNQIIYIHSDSLTEDKTETTWGWSLTEQSGYYTSSDTGEAHIEVED